MHLLHVSLFSALVLLGISINSSSSAKIGIFVAPVSNSIVLYAIRLAEILTTGGHEVVIIRPTFNPNATKLVSKNPKVTKSRDSENSKTITDSRNQTRTFGKPRIFRELHCSWENVVFLLYKFRLNSTIIIHFRHEFHAVRQPFVVRYFAWNVHIHKQI